ncbi:MAG: hypothetical protein J6U96_00290 [Elusimicrobiaceae bacterium]|nr:hypothetical protein [Elusimicrobiaceae bacterium]
MHTSYKLLSATLIISLLVGSSLSFAQQEKPAELSLYDLQQRARIDYQIFQQYYPNDTQKILPAALAVSQFILLNQKTYQTALEELEQLQNKLLSVKQTAKNLTSTQSQKITEVEIQIKNLHNKLTQSSKSAKRLLSGHQKELNEANNQIQDLFEQLIIEQQANSELADLYTKEITRTEKQIEELHLELQMRKNADLRVQKLEKQLAQLAADGKAPKNQLPELINYIDHLKLQSATQTNHATFYELLTFAKSDPKFEQPLADFFTAIKQWDRKRAAEILHEMYQAPLTNADHRMIENLIANYRPDGYTSSFTQNIFKKLSQYYAKAQHSNQKQALQALGKKLLSKTNITMALAITIMGVAAAYAQPTDEALANRLTQNISLFLNATPEELKQIAQDPQAAQTCQDIAQTLHEWATLAELDQNDLQDLQKKLTKKEITKSLQTVKAY